MNSLRSLKKRATYRRRMNIIIKIVCLAGLALILDLPWLYIQSARFQDLFRDIQGDRPMNVRLWGAVPVYLAIGYLVSEIHSAPRAFFTGVATYAIYDFTQLTTFDKYPLSIAVADSIWGGILMALVWWSGVQLNLIAPRR
jgi:uncharacterized membrane protein